MSDPEPVVYLFTPGIVALPVKRGAFLSVLSCTIRLPLLLTNPLSPPFPVCPVPRKRCLSAWLDFRVIFYPFFFFSTATFLCNSPGYLLFKSGRFFHNIRI